MIGTTDGSETTPTWDDTLPHFSVSEKGDRITAEPLDAEGIIGIAAVLAFVSWLPVSAGAALFFHHASLGGNPTKWHYALVVLYAFLPMILTDLTVDEARDRFGRRSTAKPIAATIMLTGLTVGFLLARWWTDGRSDGWITVAAAACLLGAVLAALASWWSLRYTRRRQVWMASLRRNGVRTSGRLREVTFLRQWADSRPLFRVVVEYRGAFGPRTLTANMITTERRVPRPNAAVVVTYSPHDPTAEPLIELDHTSDPAFDPDHAEYVQPSGH
ncbi:hypothetical protein [Mycolicibacterium thermoresistibile]